ncbi:hypothetical protein [Sphingomonas sp.]|uniref:hypothetical protein n=1 Tax=Sphingomonas sp. TaxID=28214 RepID=UPI0035AF302B
MTHYTRADLDMVDRHIAQGERHIVQQEQRVTSLRLKQLPTAAAEAQLVALNATLVQHRAHRSAIAEALDEGGRPPGHGGSIGSAVPDTLGDSRK